MSGRGRLWCYALAPVCGLLAAQPTCPAWCAGALLGAAAYAWVALVVWDREVRL